MKLAILLIALLTATTAWAAQASRLLQWIDRSDDEDGFIIEAQRGNSGYYEVARIGPDQTSFRLTVQRNECYRVRAYNKWGVSAPSNQVCGRDYV